MNPTKDSILGLTPPIGGVSFLELYTPLLLLGCRFKVIGWLGEVFSSVMP
jgi:hypothetical protein